MKIGRIVCILIALTAGLLAAKRFYPGEGLYHGVLDEDVIHDEAFARLVRAVRQAGYRDSQIAAMLEGRYGTPRQLSWQLLAGKTEDQVRTEWLADLKAAATYSTAGYEKVDPDLYAVGPYLRPVVNFWAVFRWAGVSAGMAASGFLLAWLAVGLAGRRAVRA
jgi:hypothetical protein